MPKKKPTRSPPANSRTPSSLIDALVEVEGLIRGKRWAEGRSRLEVLNQRYPGRRDVLSALASVVIELGDFSGQADVLERLSQVVPNDPEIALALGESYARAVYPFLAVRAFHRYLDRWPNDKDAGQVRRLLASLEPEIETIQREIDPTGSDAFEAGLLLDETRFFMGRGDYPRARQRAEQASRRLPRQPAVQNHLSQLALLEGKLDEAVDHARQALALDPENVHARANLTIYLARGGRFDEAREIAARLVVARPERPDAWVKQAEALSYLGDDEGVLAAYERAREAKALDDSANDWVFEHLAAVAAARVGRAGEARFHWGRAQKLSPGNELIESNLADLKAPVEVRHGPWPFSLPNWLHARTIDDLVRLSERVVSRGDQAVADALRGYLGQHPELVGLAPALLDRGDPSARALALQLAGLTRHPELLSALRDFAAGQRGTDADRLKALGLLRETGVIGGELFPLWQEGEWREIVPMSFEITGDAVRKHAPGVQRLAEEASEAIQEGRSSAAVPLLRQALDQEPNAPDLLHNLAMAYLQIKRPDDAEALVRQVHREHPDYFFGQVGVAQLETRAKRTEEAHRILDPLTGRGRFHRSEFVGLCLAEIELLLAENNPEGARSWLDLLASVDSRHPSIAPLRSVIDRAQKQVAQIRQMT